MLSRSMFRSVLAAAALLWVSCSTGGDSTPPEEPELFADPQVCDLPCEVVLDSGLEPTKDSPLTFTWDLGEGPVSGGARMLHTWDEAGTYTVSVTASDGRTSVTDTTTVLVEAQPKTEGTIDESGGAVSEGACTVSVPEGLAPEAFTLAVTELPSMQDAAERAFEPGEVTALGNAYDVVMPLKPETPVSISVREPEAQGADPSELAWLVRMIGRPLPPPNEPDFVYSAAPLAAYVLVPVTGVDEDGTARGEIYGHKRFQLVRLDEPLNVESIELEGEAAEKALPPIKPIIIFKRNPSRITITNYKNAIIEGYNKSRSVLLGQKQFRGPEGAVVYVGKLKNPKHAAFVPFFDRHTVHMSYDLVSEDQVKKVFAHEFFHLIQNHYSNRVSEVFYQDSDGWFNEGTASWAMDEVFDDIQGMYHATPWTRFEISLLEKITDDEALHAYQNVAFFKWAETKNEGIIKRMLEDRYASTHVTLPGAPNPLENYTIIDHLSGFKSLWPDADFLEFTYKARYLKDFDKGETRVDEIWSTDPNTSLLGKPKEVEFTDGDSISSGSGDSEDNAVKIKFEMKPNLTAAIIRVISHDLEGVLNVRFLTRSEPLDARLIVLDKATKDVSANDEIRDISSVTDDLTAKMTPKEIAYLIVVDPRWEYPTSTAAKKYEVEVWIDDPCRSIGGNIVEVTTEGELVSAARSAGPGTTIKLGHGTFSPPLTKWDTPEYGPFDANLLLIDTNLVGEGEDQTTLVISGGDLAALYTYGSSKLHNLTVEVASGSQVAALDHRDLEICNATFNFSSNHSWGIILNPWYGGATSLYMYETTVRQPDDGRGTGLWLQTCSSADPVYLTATIKQSHFSGWSEGVMYFAGEGSCGTITLDTDCKGFTNNDTNVLESYCPGGGQQCQAIERCPSP